MVLAENGGNRIFGDEPGKRNRILGDHGEFRFRITGKIAGCKKCLPKKAREVPCLANIAI